MGKDEGCPGRNVGLNGLLRTGSPKPPPIALTGSKKLPPGSPCKRTSVICAICFRSVFALDEANGANSEKRLCCNRSGVCHACLIEIGHVASRLKHAISSQ